MHVGAPSLDRLYPSPDKDLGRWDCRTPNFIAVDERLVPILGRWRQVRCWSRRCKGCGVVMSWDDRKYIEGGLAHHREAGRAVCLVTVTEGREPRSFRDSSRALSIMLRDLHRLYRQEGGEMVRLPFVGVAELQKRGAVHWHLCVAGLRYPHKKVKGRVVSVDGSALETLELDGLEVSKTKLKKLFLKHGFGTGFVGVRQLGTGPDDVSAVGRYLSKYLTKSEQFGWVPKGSQLVRSSRGVAAWWPGHSLTSLREDGVQVAADKRREAVEVRRRAAADRLEVMRKPQLSLVVGELVGDQTQPPK